MVSSAGTEPTERVCSAEPVNDAPPSEPTLPILLPYPSLTPRRPRPPLNTPAASCYADCARTCAFACYRLELEFNRQPPPQAEHTTLIGPAAMKLDVTTAEVL